MKATAGGEITAIEPGSPAQAAGLSPGDRLLAINGHALRDILDYQFYGAEEEIELLVQHADGQTERLQTEREYGEDLGIEFAAPTFDGIRLCRNRCDFCFIHQMPPGMRHTLYVRDDDYRYSFLFGNFVTLTNLTEDDWTRLAEQRLSPLYVSVHATDPTLRARILGRAEAPDVLQQLRRLGEMGISVEAQVVVAPGLNDGDVLRKTIRDLAGLYPDVHSIGVVPVGITRYQKCDVRPLTHEEASDVLQIVDTLQRGYREAQGVGLVYGSDELYLVTGRPIPVAECYDDFPQLENGVGLTRQLLDDWDEVREVAAATDWRGQHITLVTGTLIAPLLRQLAHEMGELTGSTVRVVAVENQFFGASVTVAGLLTGRDILAALAVEPPPGRVILPRAMFDAAGSTTLDDYTLEQVQAELGAPVQLAGVLGDLFAAPE